MFSVRPYPRVSRSITSINNTRTRTSSSNSPKNNLGQSNKVLQRQTLEATNH